MNYMPEMLDERKVKLAIVAVRNAIEATSANENAAVRTVLASIRKDADIIEGLARWAIRKLAAEMRSERDGVGVGHGKSANQASVFVPASTPTNSGAEGHTRNASGGGPRALAPAPLPESGEEGHFMVASVAREVLPSSPRPLSKNAGGAGQSPVARERQWPAARPPATIRKPSSVELMAARKVEDVAANSIFKTFMVRGRAIGSYRFGELDDTERLSLVEASVCRRIREHAPMTHGNLLVSSVFTEAQIKKFIADATREVADAA